MDWGPSWLWGIPQSPGAVRRGGHKPNSYIIMWSWRPEHGALSLMGKWLTSTGQCRCQVIAHSWRHDQMCGRNLPLEVGYRIPGTLSRKNGHIGKVIEIYRILCSPQLQESACRVHRTNVINHKEMGPKAGTTRSSGPTRGKEVLRGFPVGWPEVSAGDRQTNRFAMQRELGYRIYLIGYGRGR